MNCPLCGSAEVDRAGRCGVCGALLEEKAIGRMTKAELIRELRVRNPFGGYGPEMKVTTLRQTLRNYRSGGRA